MTRLLIIGLDCLGARVFEEPDINNLPFLRSLFNAGTYGILQSTTPPITVPAWTTMFTGRDPGELGIYGFRNRIKLDYDSFRRVDSRDVHFPRLWDYVASIGGASIVVGVPQTFPAPALNGVIIPGFDTTVPVHEAVYPRQLASLVHSVAPNYRFDCSDFRRSNRVELKDQIVDMTSSRFAVMRHLMSKTEWQLAVFCEIGLDRINHCFWSDFDTSHPSHDIGSEYKSVIPDYYKMLDSGIESLVEFMREDEFVMIVSDHGAKAMRGGFCINDWLIKNGFLKLNREIEGVTEFSHDIVDWRASKVWGYGGYYARLFINQECREPKGVVKYNEYESLIAELIIRLSNITLQNGKQMSNQILRPAEIYKEVNGMPPDLLGFFDNLDVRSIGSVGHESLLISGNDTGVDHANHSFEGMFALYGPNVSHKKLTANIVDVLPTALDLLKITVPSTLSGCSLVSEKTQAF